MSRVLLFYKRPVTSHALNASGVIYCKYSFTHFFFTVLATSDSLDLDERERARERHDIHMRERERERDLL